jgi:general secretion pathway protein G
MNQVGWLQTLRARRAARAPGRGRRGMTLLEILIVLAILGLVMGLLVGPQLISMFGEAESKVAQTEVKKYTFEAYTRWKMSNPGKGCPDSLADLNKYVGKSDAKDPWGNDYVMYCGDNAPAGSNGFGVYSKGPDKKEGTEDDIRSWE